jgi:predicted acylesterase/phospholipase RssA
MDTNSQLINSNTQLTETIDQSFEELIKPMNTLVFSGGGSKGYAYIGVIKYFEEKKILQKIKCIAGTSIGAFISVLICLGYTSTELKNILKDFKYDQHQSIDLMCLFERFGIDSFDKMNKFIESLFIAKNISPEITFESFFEKTRIHFICNTVCLNIYQSIICDHLTSPKMPVILALSASMAVPYLCASILYNGLTLIDGGLRNNFLIDLDYFKDHPESVIGIDLYNPINCSVKEIKTIDQFTLHLFLCLTNTSHMLTQIHPDTHIISIFVPKMSAFDFELSENKKDQSIEIGYNKTKEYFENILPKKIKQKILSKKIVIQKPNDYFQQLSDLLEKNRIDEAKNLLSDLINRDLTQSVENNLNQDLDQNPNNHSSLSN